MTARLTCFDVTFEFSPCCGDALVMRTHRNWILWRLIGIGVLSLLMIGIGGCGSKGTLSGKVTYKGNPLPQGTRIIFLNVQTDRPAMTEIKGDDGAYICEAVPLGEAQVGIQPPSAEGGKNATDNV